MVVKMNKNSGCSRRFLTAVFAPWLTVGLATFSLAVCAQQDYQLGLGYSVNDMLTVGGYFSTEYAVGDDSEEFVVDDVAILAYGNLTENFSFLAELESVDFFRHDFETGSSESNVPPAIERLYGDYKFSDTYSVRFGKQITPIGYWNLQPINVLRETTSNPRFSREMYPKFLTGLDIYGYTPFDENTGYHLYVQGTEDLDDAYININIDRHLGLSLDRQLTSRWHAGVSMGRFDDLDNTATRYLALNTRLALGKLTLFMEGIRDLHETNSGLHEQSTAVYGQGEYRLTPQHALIVRGEYFNNELTGIRERIGILGYSFRPVFPVSFKVEHQWHSDSGDNLWLGSFSVLF